MIFVLTALMGYLCGSIATAVWVSKVFYNKDVRLFGSGNAGATNVFRVLGWKPALVVTIVDIAKGALPTYLAARLFVDQIQEPLVLQILAGSCAVAGHCWTIFAGFRGGKGVATGAGMMLVLYPVAVPLCIVVFALVVWKTRYVSLGSLCAATTLPLTLALRMVLTDQPLNWPLLWLAFALLPFVGFTHRQNIQRLVRGTENKIGSTR